MKDLIKFIKIDLEFLQITKLTINELMTLLKIYFQYEYKQLLEYEYSINTIKELLNKKLIRIVEKNGIESFRIRNNALKIIYNCIDIKSINNIETNNLNFLVTKIREKFNGLKVGSMGDKTALKNKLKKWIENNPNITQEEILNAVDLYIDSLNGNYNYIQRADYFIYKKQGGVDQSRLSIFIEESKKEPENSDWGSNFK